MRKAPRLVLFLIAIFSLPFETIAFAAIEDRGTSSVETRKIKRYGKNKKYPRYSKAWWRQYRARIRRQRALQARRRALRLRRVQLTRTRETAVVQKPSILPSGQPVPTGWRRNGGNTGDLLFSIDDGRGSAAISVFGPATGETVDTGWKRTVGGVPTTTLRRQVIDRMVREHGWVVNDYQKEIGGRSVYVVVAQSQIRNGSVQSRMFYFTEVDGRIYSVSTTSSSESAERIASESEKVINSLKAGAIQQAAISN